MLHETVTAENQDLNTTGQMIANKSAGPGWGVSEPCACGTELLQKKNQLWAFRFYRKGKEPQQMHIKSRGKYVCSQAHTQHPALLLFVLSLHQLSINQTLAQVDTLPHGNTGLWGKLYKDPLGCWLYCERWSQTMKHQPREALCYGSRSLPRTQTH